MTTNYILYSSMNKTVVTLLIYEIFSDININTSAFKWSSIIIYRDDMNTKTSFTFGLTVPPHHILEPFIILSLYFSISNSFKPTETGQTAKRQRKQVNNNRYNYSIM